MLFKYIYGHPFSNIQIRLGGAHIRQNVQSKLIKRGVPDVCKRTGSNNSSLEKATKLTLHFGSETFWIDSSVHELAFLVSKYMVLPRKMH